MHGSDRPHRDAILNGHRGHSSHGVRFQGVFRRPGLRIVLPLRRSSDYPKSAVRSRGPLSAVGILSESVTAIT